MTVWYIADWSVIKYNRCSCSASGFYYSAYPPFFGGASERYPHPPVALSHSFQSRARERPHIGARNGSLSPREREIKG